MNYQRWLKFSAWIEGQRLDLLAEALGIPKEFGNTLSYIMGLSAAETDLSREELKRSMFPAL